MGSVPLDRIGRCRGTLSGRTRDRQEAQHHLMGQNQQRETDAYFQQAGQERLHEGCAYWCERREFCVINTGTVRASYIYIYIALGWDGLRLFWWDMFSFLATTGYVITARSELDVMPGSYIVT